MTINLIGSAIVLAGSARTASYKPQATAQPGATPGTDALAKVDKVHTHVTYGAGLDALRNANKLMMGYLLDVKV